MNIISTIKFDIFHQEKLNSIGYKYKFISEKSINTEDIVDCNILVCFNPFNRIDISKAKQLKYIQLTSQGVNHLPFKVLKEKSIIAVSNRAVFSIPISEWIIGKILESYKNTFKSYENQKRKIWKKDFDLLELNGKSILFLGTGTIAMETVKRLMAFGVEISGVNTNGRKIEGFDYNYSFKDIYNRLDRYDVIISTLTLTKDTKKILDYNFFSKLKDKMVFINVSRGEVVNENDLIKSLDKFRAVYLDVFENEPLNNKSSLWEKENVFITSHNSWISDSNKSRIRNNIINNLIRYKNGDDIKGKVDLDRGY